MTDKDLQIPPQNLVAEQSVIGCMLLDNTRIALVEEVIAPSDFYSDIHGMMFTEILNLQMYGQPADPVTLSHQLERSGKLDEIGGVAYIVGCLEAVPHSGNAVAYAEIVASAARRRTAINIGRTMIAHAFDMTRDEQQVIDDAHDAAMRMAEAMHVKKSRPRLLTEHVAEWTRRREAGESTKVFWGIPEIDALLGGVSLGALIVVGGRPKHGKSCLALQWLQEASGKGIAGLVISEEMTAQELAGRTVQYVSDVAVDDYVPKLNVVKHQIGNFFELRAPILVAEHCVKIANVERAIDRAVQSHGVRIVCVDHAQLVDGEGDNKSQQVGDVSQKLKQIAIKHEIIVILLSQLNRAVESRENLTPCITDLRDSGGLEADADDVLLTWVPWLFDNDHENVHEYRILCAKHRSGPATGKVITMKEDFARMRILPDEFMGVPDYSDRFK